MRKSLSRGKILRNLTAVVILIITAKIRGYPDDGIIIMSTTHAYFHAKRMWKTIVENSVENVEKLEFSTVIPTLSRFPQGQYSGKFSTPAPSAHTVTHVTSPGEDYGFLLVFNEKVHTHGKASPPTPSASPRRK